jgi:hypothetical protein
VPEPTTAPLARPWAVSLGLGVMNFTSSTAKDAADVGVAYEVRLGMGLRSQFGVEAAYIGSTQSINALGLAPGADLRSNGLEVLGRLNLAQFAAFDVGPMVVSPFLVAGAAFQRFSLANEGINTSNVAPNDNVFAIPLGVGIGGMTNRLMLDARWVWRPTFDNDMFRAPDGTSADASLSHWTLTARAGLAF